MDSISERFVETFVKTNDVATVEKIVNVAGFWDRRKQKKGRSHLLSIAVWKQYVKMVDVLLRSGADAHEMHMKTNAIEKCIMDSPVSKEVFYRIVTHSYANSANYNKCGPILVSLLRLGHFDLFENFLIMTKIDPKVFFHTINIFHFPFHELVATGDFSAVKYLMCVYSEYDLNIDGKLDEIFLNARETADGEVIRTLDPTGESAAKRWKFMVNTFYCKWTDMEKSRKDIFCPEQEILWCLFIKIPKYINRKLFVQHSHMLSDKKRLIFNLLVDQDCLDVEKLLLFQENTCSNNVANKKQISKSRKRNNVANKKQISKSRKRKRKQDQPDHSFPKIRIVEGQEPFSGNEGFQPCLVESPERRIVFKKPLKVNDLLIEMAYRYGMMDLFHKCEAFLACKIGAEHGAYIVRIILMDPLVRGVFNTDDFSIAKVKTLLQNGARITQFRNVLIKPLVLNFKLHESISYVYQHGHVCVNLYRRNFLGMVIHFYFSTFDTLIRDFNEWFDSVVRIISVMIAAGETLHPVHRQFVASYQTRLMKRMIDQGSFYSPRSRFLTFCRYRGPVICDVPENSEISEEIFGQISKISEEAFEPSLCDLCGCVIRETLRANINHFKRLRNAKRLVNVYEMVKALPSYNVGIWNRVLNKFILFDTMKSE